MWISGSRSFFYVVSQSCGHKKAATAQAGRLGAAGGNARSAEEALELVRPAFAAGGVLGAAFFQRLFQLTQQLALVFGEFDRRFHHDVAVQIARVAGAHALDALAAQAELLARLRAFGDVDGSLARQGGHFNLTTKRSGDEAPRHLAVQIVAIALKDVVRLDADFDVQVARRATVDAGLAIARGANAHAAVDARRDFDFQRLVALYLALAVAAGAGLGNDLARAPAVRAGLLHAEKALAHLHRAIAAAGAAGFGLGAGFGTAAVAGVAGVPAGDANFGRFTLGRLFQRDFHGVRQVVAPVHLPPAPATSATLATEHIAKNIAKSFGKAAKPFRAWATAHVRVHARVAVLVVGRAFLAVGERYGFRSFLRVRPF